MGSILAGLTAVLFAAVMPILLLPPAAEMPKVPRMLVIEEERNREEASEVRLRVGNCVEELPLEEYLVGVVLSEMPISFHEEALKAQAVAARTFTLRQMDNGKHEDCDLCDQSSCCQAWTGQAAMENKLGNSWEQYWEKAAAAVKSTEGVVLTYEGELIDAVYFSCSGGSTEAAVAVWGSEVPYLQSVESPGEEQAGKFLSEKIVSTDEFRKVILQAQPLADMSGRPGSWIGQVSYTDGGGVEKISIGGISFSGTQIRQMFALNATSFTIRADGENFVFSVKGYGHRVGMSQYGANAMAEEGKNYAEILRHYYDGVMLEKWQ